MRDQVKSQVGREGTAPQEKLHTKLIVELPKKSDGWGGRDGWRKRLMRGVLKEEKRRGTAPGSGND